MYIKFPYLSLLIILIYSSYILSQRSSPLQVEKDTAVYELLQKYHHYTELDSLLQQWASNYSKIAEVFDVGKSFTGRSLFVMHLTSPLVTDIEKEQDENLLLKPKFKWIANMHGDETIGREMMIALIYYLLLNSKSDTRINRLLSTTDIYIMPSMNPVNKKERKFFFKFNLFSFFLNHRMVSKILWKVYVIVEEYMVEVMQKILILIEIFHHNLLHLNNGKMVLLLIFFLEDNLKQLL